MPAVHHGAGLRALLRARDTDMGNADVVVADVARDHTTVALTPGDRALLHYGVNPARSPRGIEPAEIEHLESAGFDDHAIHDTSAIAADYAFVNRIANGLGVEFEQGAAFGGT